VSTQRFPLRPNSTIYWAVPLFAACAVFFAFKLDTDRGLILNGIIHLGVGGARIFYAALGLFSLAFVVLGIFVVVSMRGGRLAVELGEESIGMPGSPLRPRTHEFRYAEISSATLRTVSKQEFLTLVDAKGKSSVSRAHVGDAAFDKIVRHLAARVPAPRAQLPVAKLHTP
jgi:hypothetical protein